MNGHHLFAVNCIVTDLVKLLMGKPVFVLVQQILQNGQLTMDGRQMTCILPLVVFLMQIYAFAPHQHLYHQLTIKIDQYVCKIRERVNTYLPLKMAK